MERKYSITKATMVICNHYKIDPLNISSGVMLITTNKPGKLLEAFKKEGIKATIIGKVVEGRSVLVNNGIETSINPPSSDELYKVV